MMIEMERKNNAMITRYKGTNKCARINGIISIINLENSF